MPLMPEVVVSPWTVKLSGTVIVELTELGRETTMVDRAGLVKGSDHPSIGLAEGDIPGTYLGLGGRRDHEVEAVRELLEDDHWAREQPALPVDLGTYVLAD